MRNAKLRISSQANLTINDFSTRHSQRMDKHL